MRVLFLAIPLLCAGCASGGPGSVRGGECRVFERPEFVVHGKRRYDQNWIDSNIEGGVGACGWQRPKPRPPSLDRPLRKAVPIVKAAPVPQRRFWQRRSDVGSVQPLPRPPEAPQIQPAPALLAVPIDIGQQPRRAEPRAEPVDELLQFRPRRP